MVETEIVKSQELSAEQLRKTVDPASFEFETTADLEPLEGIVGQERGIEAIETALDMPEDGFNLYASGVVGTGRHSALLSRARQKAKDRPVPSDWSYVYNFDKPDRPRSLELPPGRGNELAADMERLIEHCQEEIPKAFSGEEYEKQKNEVTEQLSDKRQELIEELREKARKLDHAIQVTPAGIVAAPLVDGEPVSQQEFEQLPEEKKEELREKNEKVQELIRQTVAEGRELEQQMKEKTQELDREIGLFAVGHLLDDLKEKYSEFPEVLDYLDEVRDDIIENVELFRAAEQQQQQDIMGMKAAQIKQAYNKYKVNVVVDNSDAEGAPVVHERNPTYYNLIGQLEYKAQFGGMTTDFTMVRAGALLEANGGYLVLDVIDVLTNPLAWEALKRTLHTGEVKIENMWEQYRPIPAATIEPEAIPVDVKVMLVGNPLLYQLLYMLDDDFQRLFKIKADFDVEMDLTDEFCKRYAAFVSSRCEEADLPPFDRGATARIIEHGMRLAGHKERLSTRFLEVADLITESAQKAKTDESETVAAEHVRSAIEAQRQRSRMIQDKIQRMIEEDVLLIDTEEATPGQVNGLAVLDVGDYRFGKPSRITCVTSVGRAGVVNIERESKMSGSIHDKAVMILSGYMASRFGQDKPLALSASLCFEQSYSEVEGDSASCAELCAILSDLADLPLRQDIAITGSINQKGQVQAIGGANEKIEGFFEVCQQRGLTGDQGVIIPEADAQHLMLKDEVVEACEKGQFHVWTVGSVEEAIEILTGMPAGEKQEDGSYPEETVYGRVDSRLREMAGVLKEYGPAVPSDESTDSGS